MKLQPAIKQVTFMGPLCTQSSQSVSGACH